MPATSRRAGTGRPTPAERSLAGMGRHQDTANLAVLDAFLARYNDTFFAELARARIRS